jgi:hypothetical protein
MKEYVYYMVESFNIGPDATQVGLATFSTHARAQFYLNQYRDKQELQDAISAISYEYGNTNTAAGLKLVRSGFFAQRRGDRPEAPDYGQYPGIYSLLLSMNLTRGLYDRNLSQFNAHYPLM